MSKNVESEERHLPENPGDGKRYFNCLMQFPCFHCRFPDNLEPRFEKIAFFKVIFSNFNPLIIILKIFYLATVYSY